MIQRVVGLLFIVIGLATSIGKAQSPQTRALRLALRQASTDTARVLLLADLAATYRYSRYDSVQWYARQGLDLARRIGYRKGEGRCLSRIALLLGERGNLPQALRVDLQALHLNEASQDLEGKARTLNQTGLLYFALDDYRPALQYFFRAWRLYQHLPARDTSQLVSVLTNMGASYEGLRRYDSATFFMQRAWQLTTQARSFNTSPWGNPAPYVLRELGLLEVAQGKPAAALDFYRRSVRAAVPENDRRSASRSYQYMAELYHDLHQPDSSIYYARKSLLLGRSLPFMVGIVRNSKLLTETFQRRQQPDSTLKYMRLLLTAQDSLYDPTRIKQLNVIGFGEQQRLRQLERERREFSQQVRTAALLAGLGVLLLVLVLLGRSNRQQKRANRHLQSLNEQITHQAHQLTAQRDNLARTLQELKIAQSQLVLREKMASLGELMAGVAYEIQGPVSSVRKFAASSVELCGELRQEVSKLIGRPYDQEILDEMLQNLLQNQTRILQFAQRADSIVRGMLEYSQDGSGPRQLTTLNALAEEYLRLTYHDLRAKNRYFNAALLLRLDPAVGTVQIVRQDIGRALVGLFNAALQAVLQRQADADPEDGYIPQVELHTHRAGETVELRVRDNGPGLSPEARAVVFQRFSGPDTSADLGLPLSYDLVTKGLGGQLTATSAPNQGTEYVLTLLLPVHSAL